jgi:uncharacterized delta-60 repeat protein
MVVVGQTVIGASSYIAIARYLQNGNPDTTFLGMGKRIFRLTPGLDAFATDAIVQPDNKIVILGAALNPNNHLFDFALVRLNPNGRFDRTFSGDGKVTIEFVGDDIGYSLARRPSDGKYVLGGKNDVSPSGVDFALAQVLP